MELGIIILIISIIFFILTIIALKYINNIGDSLDIKNKEVKFHPCLDPSINVLSEENILDYVNDSCKSECIIDNNHDNEIQLTKLKSKSTIKSCFINKFKGKCEYDANCEWDESGLNINNGGICNEISKPFIDCNNITEDSKCGVDNDCEWNDTNNFCDFKIIKEVIEEPEIEYITYTKPPCMNYCINCNYMTIGGKIP